MDFGDDGVGLVEVADLASISGAADEVFDDYALYEQTLTLLNSVSLRRKSAMLGNQNLYCICMCFIFAYLSENRYMHLKILISL